LPKGQRRYQAQQRNVGRDFPKCCETSGAAGIKEYVTVLERDETNWGAYAPRLPGLGVVADTHEEAERLIRDGIGIYLDKLRAKGKRLAEPAAQTRRVQGAASRREKAAGTAVLASRGTRNIPCAPASSTTTVISGFACGAIYHTVPLPKRVSPMLHPRCGG